MDLCLIVFTPPTPSCSFLSLSLLPITETWKLGRCREEIEVLRETGNIYMLRDITHATYVYNKRLVFA